MAPSLSSLFSEYATTALTEQDYASQGLPAYAYGRVKQILDNDRAHVTFLQNVLGNGTNNIPPCEYDFSAAGTNLTRILANAIVVKQVATSSYTGSLNNLDSAFARSSGTIQTTEARHQTWLESVLQPGAPWT